MLSIRTVTGRLSWTQVTNISFLVLWALVQIANGFGFATFQPSDEALVILPAIIALINMLLRKYHTTQPLA